MWCQTVQLSPRKHDFSKKPQWKLFSFKCLYRKYIFNTYVFSKASFNFRPSIVWISDYKFNPIQIFIRTKSLDAIYKELTSFTWSHGVRERSERLAKQAVCEAKAQSAILTWVQKYRKYPSNWKTVCVYKTSAMENMRRNFGAFISSNTFFSQFASQLYFA